MREWMRLFESQLREIEVSDQFGSAEGYVTDTAAEQVDNWFAHRHNETAPDTIKMIRNEFSRIAFLNNINVPNESQRGRGNGKALLDQFIDEAAEEGAESIFLFADQNEDQIDGFELQKWYVSQGFEEVHPATGLFYLPLMMLDLR